MNKILYILLTTVLLASCSKSALDLVNPNTIIKDNYWKNEDDVRSALAATYALFKNVDGGYWGVRGVELSNGRGDDFFIRNDVGYLYQLSTFTNTPDNSAANNVWNISYRAIYRANQIIENVAKIESLTDDQKNAFTAEAKFIRGLNEFILAVNFNDVPIRTTVPVTQSEYAIAKSTAAEVWAQVIKDFTDAAAGLPLSYDAGNKGRATKGAALGFLGKSYVYTKDWANAEATLEQLTTGPYSYQLLPDFGTNFIAAGDNKEESLFEIQLSDVGGTNPWAGENSNETTSTTTAQEFAPAEVNGWFEVAPTDKLFNEFQLEKTVSGELDPRMYATLIWDYPNAVFYQKPFTDFKLPFGFKSFYKKYQNYDKESEQVGKSGAQDYASEINEKAMRYADVLLLLAESLTMQNRPAEAYTYVTQIRNRANLPLLATDLDQAQMMKEIKHQRMLEFAREGQRFYDLQRWGDLQTEISNSDKVGKQYYVVNKHDFFPVPQDEVNSNPLMKQNTYW